MNYPVGSYAIGLSRQAGLDRNVDANWKWETGDNFDANIPWAVDDPNGNEGEHQGVRIDIPSALIRDNAVDVPVTDWRNKGYICEYDFLDHLYFQSTEPRGVTMDASYIRCALRCRRQKDCHGFHLDDAGCQLETNRDNKREYSKIIY